MTTQQRADFERHIAHLRQLDPGTFWFGWVYDEDEQRATSSMQHSDGSPLNSCGTVGCAIGHLPGWHPRVSYPTDTGGMYMLLDGVAVYWADIAAELFGMDYKAALNLFSPNQQDALGLKTLSCDVLPSEVADLMQAYLDRYHPLVPAEPTPDQTTI